MDEEQVKKLSFEESLKALEDTVERLTDSSTTLDETLLLYSQGVQYLKHCQAKLSEVEAKIKLISEGLPPRSSGSEATTAEEEDDGS
ncbi:MAG: exodeoxyribonuclease small subunit [Candidatus Cloacimonadota bacterium]|nr:exodeoxyribonuclease small subunit [Candidatus Cloacimonadota bacterium]